MDKINSLIKNETFVDFVIQHLFQMIIKCNCITCIQISRIQNKKLNNSIRIVNKY